MSATTDRIIAIRAEANFDDAEALARMFEDDQMPDDGEIVSRLTSIFDATRWFWLPLYTYIEFHDQGF